MRNTAIMPKKNVANTPFVAGEILLQKVPEQQILSPPQEPAAPHEEGRRLHFWGTFAVLCTLAFILALDVSIISTSLPAIIASIGGATEFVWVANSFVIASTVPQPLFCQVADISGRCAPLFFSLALFALGNGIGGGAHNVTMLIAGRTVQSVGAGCIYVLIDIVLLGPAPLRERGKHLGLMVSRSGVAAALGPPAGGTIAHRNWHWIFWINLPSAVWFSFCCSPSCRSR